ncbi:MAG TPA: SulP family inorganic anion transporter, partial [Thermodesulfatator atlanticus]|nr:SulP family inorganic anion transporter [Thermodesulfatator atlanticus]
MPCLRCHPSRQVEGKILKKKPETLKLEPEKLMELHYLAGVFDEYIKEEREKFKKIRAKLKRVFLKKAKCGQKVLFFPRDNIPDSCEILGSEVWRLKVGNGPLNPQHLTLFGGGEIVGAIPQGLPSFSKPLMDLQLAQKLLSAALIISLLGYMEAISIAKALAARTGQKLDANQELIGQGLANIAGSFFQSYPVSGSFSRSAVNYQAGAVSALSSVFTGLCVVATLLYFTPFLYYLPQAVLAAVVMNAVLGLLHVKEVARILKVFFPDGVICIITFLVTLYTAPHLDKGIILGVLLSIAVFFYHKMRP